jgi:hypothetical protein
MPDSTIGPTLTLAAGATEGESAGLKLNVEHRTSNVQHRTKGEAIREGEASGRARLLPSRAAGNNLT